MVKEKVRFIHENCDKNLSENKSLPYNSYLIEYELEDGLHYDIVQSVKVVDIFDHYYDKYKSKLKKITQSSGNVNPKVWNGKVSNG